MHEQTDIAIIGAGIAGISAAASARQAYPEASILIVSDEAGLPYKRTTLSKKLAEGVTAESFNLTRFADDILPLVKYIPSLRVTALDTAERTLTTADGGSITARTIILACGAVPRMPRCGWQPAILPFRTREDALTLGPFLQSGRTILVGGDGVLAVELACQCSKAGMQVTLAGRNRHILQRQFDQESASRLEGLLGQHAIHWRPETDIDTLDHADGKPLLAKNNASFDCAVIAAGVIPRTGLFPHPAGIPVDQHCQTGYRGIFAAGDCSMHEGVVTTLWHQAEAQGKIAGLNAAASLKGLPLAPYTMQPQRVKCRIFDCFTWSCNPGATPDSVEIISSGPMFVRLLGIDGHMAGATAIGIPEELDAGLSEAVRDAWPLEQVRRLLTC